MTSKVKSRRTCVEAAKSTCDGLFGGRLVVHQPAEGYRFSIDAVLLAGLSRVSSKDHVVELGTGCGVVLLILAYRGLGRRLEGVEIQPELAALARKNVSANKWEGRVTIHEGDVRKIASILPGETFDVVLSNPPYRKVATGRLNPSPQKAIARHELMGTLEDFFRAARHLLKEGGRLNLIYPAFRLDDLMLEAVRSGFRPKVLTMIYSHRGSPGRLVHLECRKGGGAELKVAPPFFIYEEHRRYTDAMARLYRE